MISRSLAKRVRRDYSRRVVSVGVSSLSLPRSYLFRSRLPNTGDVVYSEDDILDADMYIGGWVLPDTDECRAAVPNDGFWYDAEGTPIARTGGEILEWSGINSSNAWFSVRRGFVLYPDDITERVIGRIARYYGMSVPDIIYPTAFFNGMDFRLLSTAFVGGPTYAEDNLGVLQSPGANLPAVQGMRLDGTTYVTTDSSGDPIVASTEQKTVAYSEDWATKTFAETFDKFDTSDPLKAPGWLCEPVRTNKVICRKSNPVDLTYITIDTGASGAVVDDTAALTAAGLIGICDSGKVYEFTVPNSKAIRFIGSTGNTNHHSSSIILRTISGTGCNFGLTSTTRTEIEASSTYRTFKQEAIPAPLATSAIVLYNPTVETNVVRCILPQLEEGVFATSPICKASDGSDPLTSLTRSATIASFQTAGKIPVNDFAIRMIVVPRATGQSGVYLFGSYVDANNYTAVTIDPTALTIRKRISGVNTDAAVSLTHGAEVPIDLVLSVSTLGMQISARSYSDTWGAFTTGMLNSSEAAKANAQIAATYQLGALNSSSQFTGNISLFDCVPIPTGITDPMAWAKNHWGVA